MKVAVCHPNKRHYAKGLCRLCYKRKYHSFYWKNVRLTKKALCHPEKALYSKGLCVTCYGNQAHIRDQILQRNYGITIDEYTALLKKQNGQCALCQKPSLINLAVDHCHKTGLVRGLLCKNCNTAIGLFREDVTVLQKAISYLGGICGQS